MPITYTTDFKGQNSGVGAAITSNALTVSAGDFIAIVACYENNTGSTAWTVSNNGTAITWTQRADTNTTNNCRLVLWTGVAGATPPTTITVTTTAGATINDSKSLATFVHTGQHATNPIPSGNIFTGANLTGATRTITPTATGSALWMAAGDFQATNTFAAIANNTLVGTFNEAARMTATAIRPTTQPRTDAAVFTLGETDTSGTIAYIAFEVQAAASPSGGTINQTPTKKRKTMRTNTSDFTGFGAFSAILTAAGLFDKDLVTVVSAGGAVSHDTTGALVGQGSTVTGTATHIAVHGTTGALIGQGSTITGTAARTREHSSNGALVGQGSTVTGAAQHNTPHPTSGALVGQGSTITGSAARTRVHDTTGALTGQGSEIAGNAARSSGATSHDATGALIGQGSAVDGISARTRVHPTSGALVGQGSVIAGTAQHNVPHGTTGALIGQGSAITGTAQHSALHTTTGVLIGQGSAIVGAAARAGTPVTHDTTGALVGQGSTITGSAAKGTIQPVQILGGSYYYKPRHLPIRKAKELEKAENTQPEANPENDSLSNYPKIKESNRRSSDKRLAKAKQEVRQANQRLFNVEAALIQAENEAKEAQLRLIAYLEEQEAEIDEESVIMQIMMEFL